MPPTHPTFLRSKPVAVVLGLTTAAAVSGCSISFEFGSQPSASSSQGQRDSSLSQLQLRSGPEREDYNRDLFPTWLDQDGNGCEAREDVLIEESTTPARVADNCDVVSGTWLSPYDGVIITDPSEVQIDHLDALSDAWRSGAWAWTTDQRATYANDIENPAVLVATSARSNQSKGDRSPDEWKPPLESYWCTYAQDWVDVKVDYTLSITFPERDALGEMLDTCTPADNSTPGANALPSSRPARREAYIDF